MKNGNGTENFENVLATFTAHLNLIDSIIKDKTKNLMKNGNGTENFKNVLTIFPTHLNLLDLK